MEADSLKPPDSLLVPGWNCSAESVEGCRLHDHIEKVLLFGFILANINTLILHYIHYTTYGHVRGSRVVKISTR